MLFISGHLPSLTFPEAGQKICFNNLVDYAKNKNVDLVVLVNSRESSYALRENFDFCKSVTFIKIGFVSRLYSLLRSINLPLDIAVRNDPRLIQLVKNYMNTHPEAEIHMEYEQTASVLFYLPNKVNSTVVFHDVISQSVQRRYVRKSVFSPLRWFWKYQFECITNWEKKLASLTEKAVALSLKDKELLVQQGFGVDRISVVLPKVSEIFSHIKRENSQSNVIVFWGAMNRSENEDAVLWFAKEILPIIHSKKPEVVLYVVGANPTTRLDRIKSKNIVVTGYVDSPVPYFEKAALIVAPLRFGAGVKIKVLEALAAKVPVVATSVAAEGIDPCDLLNVVDEPDLFAAKVIEFLDKG